MALRIGIDANCWGNRRGYGRYARELIRALLAHDRVNEYRFFIDAKTLEGADDLPQEGRRIVVETSRAAAQAAAAEGSRSLGDLWAMARAARAAGRDLDLFYFPSVYTFFPLALRARVVVTIHDTIAERHPDLVFPGFRSRLLWTLKVRLAVWRADLVATVSEAARGDIVRRLGVRDGAVRVIPDAASAIFRPVTDRSEADRVLARYGLAPRNRFLLYVGGLSPHKNVATLLHAYAALSREAEDLPLLILAGDFERDVFYSSYPELRRLVEQYGLGGSVLFAGFVPDEALVHLYNAADLLVIPSLTEGFGLPAVEAMACARPVVASRAGALPEVVGNAGLYFDPGSPAELADRLRTLIADERLRADLGRRGLARAAVFSWERSARALLSAFEELAGGRRPHA